MPSYAKLRSFKNLRQLAKATRTTGDHMAEERRKKRQHATLYIHSMYSSRIACEKNVVSLLESGEWRYIKAINNNSHGKHLNYFHCTENLDTIVNWTEHTVL